MHDELDEIYARAKSLWEDDPEKLEREQPLLARAFADQPPNLESSLAIKNQQIEALGAHARSLEREMDDRLAHAAERERVLKRDLTAEQRQNALLAGELVEARQEPQEVVLTEDEAHALSGLGWSKGA